MSHRIHPAAAAQQLNRTLFTDTQFEGSVSVVDAQLEVAVRGPWGGERLPDFAGYPILWRQMDAA